MRSKGGRVHDDAECCCCCCCCCRRRRRMCSTLMISSSQPHNSLAASTLPCTSSITHLKQPLVHTCQRAPVSHMKDVVVGRHVIAQPLQRVADGQRHQWAWDAAGTHALQFQTSHVTRHTSHVTRHTSHPLSSSLKLMSSAGSVTITLAPAPLDMCQAVARCGIG
jgi:hypothetical protein